MHPTASTCERERLMPEQRSTEVQNFGTTSFVPRSAFTRPLLLLLRRFQVAGLLLHAIERARQGEEKLRVERIAWASKQDASESTRRDSC